MAEEHPAGVSLLDEEGGITEQIPQLEICLKHIFSKYCEPRPETTSGVLAPPPGAFLSEEGLQRWAIETNGEPFSEETKEEVVESFDVTDDGNLTLKGFFQLYQLQTENDEQETWKDLKKHGFDEKLNLVALTASS